MISLKNLCNKNTEMRLKFTVLFVDGEPIYSFTTSPKEIEASVTRRFIPDPRSETKLTFNKFHKSKSFDNIIKSGWEI